MGVAELAAALKSRALSSREATQALLARIAAHQALGAFLHVDATAPWPGRGGRRAIAAGQAGALTGVPLAHKDIFVTADCPPPPAPRCWPATAAPSTPPWSRA
jgi:aspartyl-tRNA(Asn)/glutamyl-tRNA(Gln) amidotransferase subunit A